MLNWRQKRGSAVPDNNEPNSTSNGMNHRHHDAYIQMSVYTRLFDIYKVMYSPTTNKNQYGRWVSDVSWTPTNK
jgi:hypothetical protein